ncbi:MAG: hypothetical protein Q9210_007247 [Variospora velana]
MALAGTAAGSLSNVDTNPGAPIITSTVSRDIVTGRPTVMDFSATQPGVIATQPSATLISQPSVNSAQTTVSTSQTGAGFGLGIPLLLMTMGIMVLLFRLRRRQSVQRNEISDFKDDGGTEQRITTEKHMVTTLPELEGVKKLPELHGEHLRELPSSPRLSKQELP